MSTQNTHSRHWRSAVDEDGVCWLTLDKADSGANTLSSEVLDELAHELEAIRAATPRGVVIESGKRSGFILGADVNEFSTLRDATRAADGPHFVLIKVTNEPWGCRKCSSAFIRASAAPCAPCKFSVRRSLSISC